MTKITKIYYQNFLKNRRPKAKVLTLLHLPLYFLIALLCIVGSPVLAKVPDAINLSSQLANTTITNNVSVSPLEQGKMLYDVGRFAEAVQVLQQAAEKYQQQEDNLRLAITLSNLSLAYQQLGAWNEAKQAITDSLNLLKTSNKNQNLQVLAQSLDIQGRLQLAMGQAEEALTTWQQTAEIYKQAKNFNGEVRSQINQAQAWRTQGFYTRAVKILKEVDRQLQSQPDSIEKAVALRSLGDAQLVAGNLEECHNALNRSLAIAQNLQSHANIAASLFSLGNYARIKQEKENAITYYQQTIQISTSPLVKVQAQLNLLSLLIPDRPLATQLLPLIQSQLQQLPPSRAAIYAQINFAQSLMKLSIGDRESGIGDRGSAIEKESLLNSQSPVPSPEKIAQLLETSVQQSRSLGDKRAEAYALLSLGNLYEKTQQLSKAQSLTEQGLVLAQTSNAQDIAYRLEWQLGRLLRRQNDIKGAIAAYDTAVESLKSLRNDLVAVNQDVQFNFRDSVEPVYRESVELLMQSPYANQDRILDKARQRIEALQLAELDNFFQEACLQGESVTLDRVVDQENPTAAILYPIILPEELQVIVKIPRQQLQHYSTKISPTEVEEAIAQLQETLVNPAAINVLKNQSRQVYNWLIKPIEKQLAKSKVDTLVFVLDGALRNLPMAALYDGEKYLVQKYAIALSVGLQLQNPKRLRRKQLRALTAGLTQPPPGYSNFGSLPAIKSEINLIASAGISTTSLLDKDFTRKALENKVSTVPFNIVHLATHGQFSSNAENTFILAASGPIKVKDFNILLRNRDESRSGALELLFLSACQTAVGDNRATLGLAGAAVRAGAGSTLASLWQIEDEPTALFVGEFYRQLRGKEITKAQALRCAQLKLLGHPNYNAPSFWSAYVLVGNWL
ncbi:CHAT domain-containing protein [Nostocaceae cyanobacterium CENA369]|uniref:CHAT domain-containing protein n=1 Tax=Dendronalium phyllosphericum CENA369 TaxID=1725256 RepID=A0A8J7HXB4_9NOST|nr:CHAT domain-containing protein [Dendronalium phyllosphericum]MBH8571889.1 CHAT domain-containing protein [Dendronalium phyllosphericum CENA369]